MAYNKDRRSLISNDLTTNANAGHVTSSVRDPNIVSLTRYNVNEKLITAKFLKFEDLKKSYDILIDHGFNKDEIILAIIGKTEDKFFNSLDELEKEYNPKNEDHRFVSMGLESLSKEITYYVSGVWDSNNAAIIND